MPGVAAVLGFRMGVPAATMELGHTCVCLPRRVAELQFSRHRAQRVPGMMASAHAMAGRLVRVRLSHLAAACRGHGSLRRLD